MVGKGRKKERLGERKRGRGGEGDVGDRRSLMGEGGREGGRKERREERHACVIAYVLGYKHPISSAEI